MLCETIALQIENQEKFRISKISGIIFCSSIWENNFWIQLGVKKTQKLPAIKCESALQGYILTRHPLLCNLCKADLCWEQFFVLILTISNREEIHFWYSTLTWSITFIRPGSTIVFSTLGTVGRTVVKAGYCFHWRENRNPNCTVELLGFPLDPNDVLHWIESDSKLLIFHMDVFVKYWCSCSTFI